MKLLNKVKILLIFAFFIVILFNVKSFAVTGVITEITVNLRKEPSTDSKKIMYVTQDYKVEVLEKVGEWYKIKYDGVTGYVFGKYVDVDDTKLEIKEQKVEGNKHEEIVDKNAQKEENIIQDVTTIGEIKLKIKKGTYIRLIPNITSNILYTAKEDISVDVIDQVGVWSYILVDNTFGWSRTENIIEENIKQEENKSEEIKKEEVKKEETRQEEKTAYIKYDKVNLRKKASTSSTVLAKLKLNDKVIVLEEVDSKWSKIKFGEKVGYVSTELLANKKQIVVEKEKTETTKQEEKTAYIKYNTVNLREKASTSAKVLAKLKLNQQVIILQKVNNVWSQVKVDGKIGYISTELLASEKQKDPIKDENNTTSRDGETISRGENEINETVDNKINLIPKEEINKNETTTSSTTKEQDSSSKINGGEIVKFAKKYLGYKYVYGGSNPKTGFDCSGFTQYVYKQFGYKLSRTSTAQAKNGKEISRSNLQPGDLIILKNTALTKIGHVGIYIGDNKIIHASEPGVGVIITDLDAKGYNYKKRYVTARRIIE